MRRKIEFTVDKCPVRDMNGCYPSECPIRGIVGCSVTDGDAESMRNERHQALVDAFEKARGKAVE